MNLESTTTSGDSSPMAFLSELISQSGGLQGLVQTFETNGLSGLIRSWIGTGENQIMTSEQAIKILNSEKVAPLLAKFGLTPSQAEQQLTAVLPRVIDRLTPNGEIKQNEFSLSDLVRTSLGGIGESLLHH